jgi:DNA-binding transcriptional MerR regulator/quercetin dioxygenase-like cupin family protein
MCGETSNGVAAPSQLWYAIGEAARLTGVSQGLLRVWEREGLISPQRTPGGHRFYAAEDLERLRQIAHLRRVERLNTAAIRRELGTADKAGPAEPPDDEQHVGVHLRALRMRQGLSLADVAERTGLSISFLSAVERGQASISLGNLFKLADAYGTTVPGLNPASQREQRTLLHPHDRPRFVAHHGLVLIEDLLTRPGALEAQRIAIQPGGGCDEPYAHPGEEFIYVLAGHLTFWIDEREHYCLHAGDALSFASTQLHRWRNDGDTPTTVLWINVPLVEPSAPHAAGRHTAHQRAADHL